MLIVAKTESGAVGVWSLTVEPSHEDYAIDTHLPLLTKHDLGLLPKCGGIPGLALLACFPSLDELLGFGEKNANEADADGDARADPKHHLPAVGFASDAEVGACCADVTEAVSLLEDAGHETSGINGAVF